ncbi:NAD(P)H-dependent FMN reductase [Hoeflea marina]|uniref:NAD(P)H-dependent FMN reductase n=1 Tax=Hoeflea marina TaxID=274592 RepID=A0A317PMM3_9HYPH|nr:NAD(P)H-dependent oxidoreductase [Hoeflea marina]PWW02006.1 NAD(P)H-dependent FMN reductase [Hoeflea marina]
MSKLKIGIIIGTTRKARFGDRPAAWIEALAGTRNDMDVEIFDLAEYPMPFFEEMRSPAYGAPTDPNALRWNAKMADLDGYIFITAEYNHSMAGALKNALDYGYYEYNRKPAAFVAYGGVGGARAVEQLRLVAVELQLAPLRTAVHIGMEPMMAVMKGEKAIADFEFLNDSGTKLLDDLAWWTSALKTARDAGSTKAAAA